MLNEKQEVVDKQKTVADIINTLTKVQKMTLEEIILDETIDSQEDLIAKYKDKI